MNKAILTAALVLTLGAGAASAQENLDQVAASSTSLFMQQAPAHREHASGRGAYSAAARNVGPGSSVTGYYESDLGSTASGNDENPRAPAAGGTGMGGN